MAEKKAAPNNPISRLDISAATTYSIKTVKIPSQLWNCTPNAASYNIQNPMARFEAVNAGFNSGREDLEIPLTILKEGGTAGKVDFHYQSLATLRVIIDKTITAAIAKHKEVWVVIGAGHHVDKSGFQKGGGILEAEVETWLKKANMRFAKGKGGGSGGAILIY